MSSNKQLFLQHLAQTSPFPLMLEIERAEGIYLFDQSGKKIIDLISGIGVSSLGHNHPAIQQAVTEQVQQHMHVMVYGELIQSPQVMLAEKLMQTLPSSLNNAYFVNSGSEATEGALKLARRHTGRHEILYCHDAYHGATLGALSVGGGEWMKGAFRPLLPAVSPITFGDHADLDHITKNTAAVLIETVQGEAGVRIADKTYFEALHQKCDDTGTLLIFDEIQCGMGRTGKFWAFEHYDVTPDILLAAKALGGGMPLGAFIAKREIMQSLMDNPVLGHITTFGGHPVSCAASRAAIDILLKEDLIDAAAQKGKYLKEKLLGLPHVQGIRQIGLMMAVEFQSFELLQQIIRRAIDHGLLTDWFLHCNNSMRIAPPLTVTYEELDLIAGKLEEVLNEVKE